MNKNAHKLRYKDMKTDNKQKEQIFNRIMNLVKNNPQGFTATPTGRKLSLKNGYAVSVTNNKSRNISLLIDRILNLNKDLDFKIGGWYDKKAKEFYLDLSIVEPSLIIAESIAKEFNQLAVFDFANLSEIRL